jgi:hypothetical protein
VQRYFLRRQTLNNKEERFIEPLLFVNGVNYLTRQFKLNVFHGDKTNKVLSV